MQKDSRPLNDLEAIRLADLFSTLSDASRVRIISALLQDEMSVGALVESLEMSQSAISHQLRVLRNMRLVRTRKEGRQVFYRLDDDHVKQLFRTGLDHVLHG